MRILHAPSNIADQAWSAAQGLRAHGHEVQVWHYGSNPFAFHTDRTVEDATEPGTIIRVLRDAIEADFDVFHFHFARSLVPARGTLPWFWDLPLLRALDKRIVFTFHGTDIRIRSEHLQEDPWSYYRFADVPCDEEMIRARLDVIRAYADHLIIANPLNRAFVPEAIYVPKMIDLTGLEPPSPARRERPSIVHVPSRRATKGTEFVLRGIQELQERGLSFDFRLAESLPHDELLKTFSHADIVVDNLLLGDCEVSALEAMALGKPVVTRVRDEVFDEHPGLPAVPADPDTFVTQMEPLLKDADARAELGERGRRYVESEHAAPVVARTLLELYEKPGVSTQTYFPGWSQPPRGERIGRLEERIRTLEAREGSQRRAVEASERRTAHLRAKLSALEATPEVRWARKFRRWFRREGRP